MEQDKDKNVAGDDNNENLADTNTSAQPLQNETNNDSETLNNIDIENNNKKAEVSDNSVSDNLAKDEVANKAENSDSGDETPVKPKKKFVVKIKDFDDKDGYNGVKTEEEEEDEEPPSRKIKVLKGTIYTVCIILFSVLLAVIILLVSTDYVGMLRPYASANVKIPKNVTTSQVADILKSKGIIRSSLVFKVYMDVSKKSGLKDGTYTLNSQMSYNEIIKTLRSSKNRSTVTVTIPEGYSVLKMSEVLEKKGVCSSKDFLAAADSKTIKFDFQSQIPEDKKRLYRLEGYLFPDTYEFYVDQSADSVVQKMLDNFDTRFSKELRADAKSKGMTVDNIVNLASVIQAETGGSDQMKAVSSVFHNRLTYGVNGNKKLQSDVTVLYGTNVIKTVLGDTEDSKKLQESYDTYKIDGLPAGPINNPGLGAIKAALDPSQTNNYFFVTDKAGNYYYARTYYQHKINVKKALANGQAVGTDTQSN